MGCDPYGTRRTRHSRRGALQRMRPISPRGVSELMWTADASGLEVRPVERGDLCLVVHNSGIM